MKAGPIFAIAGLLLGLQTYAASFQPLGDLSGGTFLSVANAISADGKVVVGYSASGSGSQAFRWTSTNGMVALGDLPGGAFSSFAQAVSADGAVIAGFSTSSNGFEAFRWTTTNNMVGLGDLTGGNFSSRAYGISADGQVIVGQGISTNSGTKPEAFRWTATDGMVGLGDLAGGDFSSRAWGVSADGSLVVGESSSTNGAAEAMRWTAATGMVGLGDFPSDIFNSIAYGISGDGSVVVGRGYSGANGSSSTHEAFRWTNGDGMSALGFLPCNTWSIAHAVSADGSVIGGDPESGSFDCAFLWDAQNGIRNLRETLINSGLNMTGWQLTSVRGISADGKKVVGYGINPSGNTEAWIADISPTVLAIRVVDGNVVLSWPTNATGFTLQSATDLALPVQWVDATNSPAVVGTEFSVTNAMTVGSQFFRLKR